VRSAKALSKYSDMVDSLARAQRDLLEGASDEARIKLREWELPEALNVRLLACGADTFSPVSRSHQGCRSFRVHLTQLSELSVTTRAAECCQSNRGCIKLGASVMWSG